MPFDVPEGHKFASVCLVNAGVDRTYWNQTHDLGNDLWAIFGPPFEIEEHWREWLGSVKSGNIGQTSLALLAHAQSDRLTILDDENEALVKMAVGVFHGLLMIEVFHHDNAIVLSGSNTGQGISVRQVSDLQHHIRPNGVDLSRITREDLQRAADIATGLRSIQASLRQHERLRNGFRAWLRGIQEYWGGDRLHQFVRAVEGVVKPEIGRSEALFVHRCQVFAGTSQTTRELLRDLYQLRSQTEHMNCADSVLAKYTPTDREAVGLQRAYEAQLLASNVYERILTRPRLQAVFDTDAHTDDFWRLQMHEQQAIWGEPINLEALARTRFTRPFAT